MLDKMPFCGALNQQPASQLGARRKMMGNKNSSSKSRVNTEFLTPQAEACIEAVS